jgi:phosphoglycolate phosphatase-like HAD superfamily hydrolase
MAQIHIFNFNDLVDFTTMDYTAYRIMCEQLKLNLLSASSFAQLKQKGYSTQEVLFSEMKEDLLKKYDTLLNDRSLWEYCIVKKGVRGTLRALHRIRDRLIIISSRDEKFVRFVLRNNGISNIIKRIYCNPDIKIAQKKALELSPDAVIFKTERFNVLVDNEGGLTDSTEELDKRVRGELN